MTTLLNNLIEIAVFFVDVMIWGTALTAGYKYLKGYYEQNSYNNNILKAIMVRGCIIIGITIVATIIVNAIFNGFKL